MENFVVSARKYRPATFNTVIGQQAITSTLKNAIKSHHLAQAFLFCGPRGVGKTTCARILAKTINCRNLTADTEACDRCESCISFNSGQLMNVFELDAASNNSVDDIRSLVDQVRFPPQSGDFKVYIIDEVHMLSQAAFNAFLKTLEEPPKYAIFILATTEKHKIIPTILSRCQVFDFNRIRVEDIAKHLAFIAGNEHIVADPDALHIIAQKADGALRDACSIFDQIVSFSGNTLTYKAVIDNLNILDYDYYFKITASLVEGNIPSSLLILNEILNNGFDGNHFITGLGEHMRNILVCKDPSTLELLEVSENIKAKYLEQSGICSTGFLLRALELVNRCDSGYKSSKNQRLHVELALMQVASINLAEAEKKNDIIIVKDKSVVAARSTADKSASPPVEPSAAKPQVPDKSTPAPPPQKKPLIRSESPSIGQFLKASVADEKKTGSHTEEFRQDADVKSLPISQELLEKAWNDYAKQVQLKGKQNLFSTLTFRKPVLKEDTQIELTIENKVQAESLDQEKTELLGFLRKELSNPSITFRSIINTVESERKPYTSGDKFKRMAEKNPAIKKLKQQFDLDIEI